MPDTQKIKSYEIVDKALFERKIKASKMCKDLGFNPSILSDWKAGRSMPKMDRLQSIADYLSIPVEQIITGKTDDEVENTARTDFLVSLSDALDAKLTEYGFIKEGNGMVIEINRVASAMTPEKQKALLQYAKFMASMDGDDDGQEDEHND